MSNKVLCLIIGSMFFGASFCPPKKDPGKAGPGLPEGGRLAPIPGQTPTGPLPHMSGAELARREGLLRSGQQPFAKDWPLSQPRRGSRFCLPRVGRRTSNLGADSPGDPTPVSPGVLGSPAVAMGYPFPRENSSQLMFASDGSASGPDGTPQSPRPHSAPTGGSDESFLFYEMDGCIPGVVKVLELEGKRGVRYSILETELFVDFMADGEVVFWNNVEILEQDDFIAELEKVGRLELLQGSMLMRLLRMTQDEIKKTVRSFLGLPEAEEEAEGETDGEEEE